MELIELLEKLTAAFGPSGCEDGVRGVIADLIAPYVGKPIADMPEQVFDKAVELLREAEAADKEWFRLSGIAR